MCSCQGWLGHSEGNLTDRSGSLKQTSSQFPVVMTKGSHLFPFRTQKLSPSVPKVLGWRRPGRIGRCRIPFRSISFEVLLFCSTRSAHSGSNKKQQTIALSAAHGVTMIQQPARRECTHARRRDSARQMHMLFRRRNRVLLHFAGQKRKDRRRAKAQCRAAGRYHPPEMFRRVGHNRSGIPLL